MDKKDKQILGELFVNSRISLNKLAKKVGVSREVANYRINKLKKEIIKEFTTQVNIKKLKFIKYVCFMRFRGITTKEEENIICYLKDHDSIMYLSPIIGKWNVSFDIIARDEKELQTKMMEITSKCSDYIDTYSIIGTGIEEGNFLTKFVGTAQKAKPKKIEKPYKVDETDKKILKLLSKNARLSYVEMAKKLKITPNSIKYRVKNLEKSGIITGYSIAIDFKKLGFELYNIQLRSHESDQKLTAFLKHHPQVIYYYKYLGHENWDIDMGLIIENPLSLRKFIIDLRKNFGRTTEIHDIYIIANIIKENFPETLWKSN
ncbi:AsnC family transcriptional regulator [Candidatus Micrarchaeota archaeon]|nr:AsnC family transcriptional regulator [Candidatus Micrarchaeota archaeon]